MARGISQAEDYLARYLHQGWDQVRALTWGEVLEKFRNIKAMVRAENGKPPEGEVDPDQKWL